MENTVILTTAVLGIVQAFKVAGLPKKFSPILAMIVGLVMYASMEGITPGNIITGIVIGLSAVGLYTTGSKLGGEETSISKQEKIQYKENLRK